MCSMYHAMLQAGNKPQHQGTHDHVSLLSLSATLGSAAVDRGFTTYLTVL